MLAAQPCGVPVPTSATQREPASVGHLLQLHSSACQGRSWAQDRVQGELEIRFEQVASFLRDLDIEAVWGAAEDQERRVLVEELVEWVGVFPDHLEVTVSGAPPLNVLYQEVGLKQSDFVRVGGGLELPLRSRRCVSARAPVARRVRF